MAKVKREATFLLVNEQNTYVEFLKKNIVGAFPGIRIESANSGETALQLFTKHEFALIITDSVLPGMGGVNFILEVKRLKPSAKIILLSGNLDKAAEKTLDREGLFGYLQKPFLMESLSELIAKTLTENGDVRLNGRKPNQGRT